MSIVFVVLLGVVGLLLVVVGSVRIRSSSQSRFELERRSEKGDEAASRELEREKLLVDLYSLRRVVTALLLVGFVLISFVVFSPVWAVVSSVVVALLYGAVARLRLFQSLSNTMCKRYEPAMIDVVKKWPAVFAIIRGVTPEATTVDISSRQEFTHVIDQSKNILSADEKKLILGALEFDDKKVREIMVSRDDIKTIKKSELLGPLTLDELHKSGHTQFPVTNGSLDEIIGVLQIQDLLIVDAAQRSVTAEKAMNPKVLYIRSDWSLSHALMAMVASHQHLFIVVDKMQKTVGLVTLADVMEALLGRKVANKFAEHDNLRAVANSDAPDAD